MMKSIVAIVAAALVSFVAAQPAPAPQCGCCGENWGGYVVKPEEVGCGCNRFRHRSQRIEPAQAMENGFRPHLYDDNWDNCHHHH